MELNILLVLRHENVCNLLYFFMDNGGRSHLILEVAKTLIFTTNQEPMFLFQYVDGGDLFQYMKTSYVTNVGLGPYLELFSYQMWRSIAFCHANAIIHRDIKPGNGNGVTVVVMFSQV